MGIQDIRGGLNCGLYCPARSLTQSFIHSPQGWDTQTNTQSLAHSLTNTHPPTHPPSHSITHHISFSKSLSLFLTKMSTRSLTQSLTRALTRALAGTEHTKAQTHRVHVHTCTTLTLTHKHKHHIHKQVPIHIHSHRLPGPVACCPAAAEPMLGRRGTMTVTGPGQKAFARRSALSGHSAAKAWAVSTPGAEPWTSVGRDGTIL